MNLIDFLKNIKKQLLNLKMKQQDLQESVVEESVIEQPKIPEIVIENNRGLFENEEEIILKGAQMILDEKRADNLEEAIIVFATMFRGLRYRRRVEDENGNKKIIFVDIDLENTQQKSL